MATGQPATDQKGKGAGGRNRMRWVLLGALAILVVGIAAGAGIWRMQQPATVSEGQTISAARPGNGQALLPIGRITVNVAASGLTGDRRTRFLVIEPTLLYDAAFDAVAEGRKMAELQPALRDSFIEYLSQLHEDDVYGSAGLADLRHELLRRARLVTASEAPISILLQDFVLQ
ncbi:flagellar basal body-associated FliL family protein [Falsigemmobacter intermedius]|uniref:flagellar basal body-associated FliL family protein n=1 Tax=Falsigemmobacter intermedius TaxID=1553448 RepID=UPI003EFD33EA